jgi:predicted Ser/Thr protein kinase
VTLAEDNQEKLTVRCLICQTDGIPLEATLCPNCGANLASLLRDTLPPGTPLASGAYRLDHVLGRGGFGITYRGKQTALEQLVAIKEFYLGEFTQRETTTGKIMVLSDRETEFTRGLSRFVREGKTLASLSHPNVVRVLNLFEDNGTAYLVMEYLSGKTLKAVAKEGRLTEDRIRQIMTALVDALAAVHDKGVFHLDIKPANVLIEPSGRTVLIDFGAARQGIHSQTTIPAYTPSYAPIEVMSAEQVGPYSDIFELGMMLYEMVTGTLPPPALDRITKLARTGDWQPDPEKCPEPWATLVRTALPLRPDDRPQTVHEWWEPVMGSSAVVMPLALGGGSSTGSGTTGPGYPDAAPGAPVAGGDIHATAVISPAVAKNGGEASYLTENNERGTFKVPPAIWDGAVHRLPGQGNPGRNGGRNGALIIKIQVRQGAAGVGTGNTGRSVTVTNSAPVSRNSVTVTGAIAPGEGNNTVRVAAIVVGVIALLGLLAFLARGMFAGGGNATPDAPKKTSESGGAANAATVAMVKVDAENGALATEFSRKTEMRPADKVASKKPTEERALKCPKCGKVYSLYLPGETQNGKPVRRKFCGDDFAKLTLAKEWADYFGKQ